MVKIILALALVLVLATSEAWARTAIHYEIDTGYVNGYQSGGVGTLAQVREHLAEGEDAIIVETLPPDFFVVWPRYKVEGGWLVEVPVPTPNPSPVQLGAWIVADCDDFDGPVQCRAAYANVGEPIFLMSEVSTADWQPVFLPNGTPAVPSPLRDYWWPARLERLQVRIGNFPVNTGTCTLQERAWNGRYFVICTYTVRGMEEAVLALGVLDHQVRRIQVRATERVRRYKERDVAEIRNGRLIGQQRQPEPEPETPDVQTRGERIATLMNLSPWQAWVHLYCRNDRPAPDTEQENPCMVTFECNGMEGEPVTWTVDVEPKTLFSYWPNKTTDGGTPANLEAMLVQQGKTETEARRRTTCEVFSNDDVAVRGYTLFGGQPTLIPVAVY